jgi:hypothetical protein
MMTTSNLPPGVESHMIPGNRPEDVAYEKLAEEVSDAIGVILASHGVELANLPDEGYSLFDIAVDGVLDVIVRYSQTEVTPTSESVCCNCQRRIVNVDGAWIDPEATGDDSVWRETCDRSEAFTGEHVPTEPTDRQDDREDMTT